MFEVNDKVFYPGHGVAYVQSIVEKKIADNAVTFYKLTFLYKDMTILLPIHNLASNGVRSLNECKMIKKAMNELFVEPEKKIESLDLSPSGWNKRNKEYQIRIKGGFFIDLVKIFRDVMYVSIRKELSFGEKNLLQSIEELMVQEIMVVQNKERSQVLQELRNPFKHLMIAPLDSAQQPPASL